MLPSFYTDDGSGLPLLLIHAFPLNAAIWQPQRRDLRHHCRVISFSLPGFGRGGDFVSGTTIDDCADLAVELLDELNVRQAVVAGCSMGGYITLAMYRRHPDRMLGMILANTRAGGDTSEAAANRRTQAQTIRGGGLDSFLAGMREKLVGPSTRESAPDVLRLLDEMLGTATVEGTAGMLEAMALRDDSSSLLASAAVPVCLIAGEEDTLIPPSEAEQMLALQPKAELHVLPNSGHLSCLERPMLFNGAVEGFLKKHFPPDHG
ncbi:MAG: alpha/beta fold hydrolase [Bacteroidetes bacterium]|nr:alpha/beta fold hydrolase [Bacteroidota bacterium]